MIHDRNYRELILYISMYRHFEMLYFVTSSLLLSHPSINVSSAPAQHFSTESENRCPFGGNVSRLNREDFTTTVWAQIWPGGLRAPIMGSARVTLPGTCTCRDRNASRAFSTTMPGARRYDVARSNGPLFASLSLHSRGRYLLRLGRGRGSRPKKPTRSSRVPRANC